MATIKLPTTLRALVTVSDVPAEAQKRGYKKLSNLIIMAGPLHVASVTNPIPGEYTEAQAVREFKNNGKRFTPGKGYEAAKRLGLF